jgi:hypothetical protein
MMLELILFVVWTVLYRPEPLTDAVVTSDWQ